ncbi:kinase-like domain-containing protein [Halteromyces radiatus]|uniref:kinase-like domain-containing protein n=1 Tax=Halteromyces radiatus TaxID=101107 RepID=UPI00221E951C|nr:kinase-like domain-containing protein [Halteromyces radiatus]KAI8089228.1 kinase-like domain-containing protein [Halteromyces radiatus]
MYRYSTPPKENDNEHFYNFFNKAKNDSNGGGLHIDTQSLGITFPHERPVSHQRQSSCPSPLMASCEPPLSPTGSPSSSSSSTSTSPALKDIGVNIPHTQHRVARNKSVITRKTSAPSPHVTCQSWEHLKSPAATFLASFASPTVPSSSCFSPTSPQRTSLTGFYQEEQQGDEIDDYVMNQVIGCGGFSTVRKGYCISNGQTVAIKIIKKKNTETEDHHLERELEIWQSLDHPNVVRIQKVLETDHATYVVCDYCSHGTLLERLQAQPTRPLSDQEKKQLFLQLCKVVDHLHRWCNVVHKDIKLDNILLDDDCNIKLCDFGLAVYQRHTTMTSHLSSLQQQQQQEHQQQKTMQHDNNNNNNNDDDVDTTLAAATSSLSTATSSAVGGSLAYCAPEQIKASHVLTCPKTDIWSLGVVLFAMFAGRLPFDDDYDVRLRQTILSGRYQVPDSFSPELTDLISHCLDPNPETRYSLDDIMKHPWWN